MLRRLSSFAWWRRQVADRWVALLVLAALLVLRAADPLPLQVMRARTFDFYQIVKPRENPATSVVAIVDIDEKSLAAVGQWPWPRTVIAELVSRLSAMGAVVVAFDVVFAEPDRMSPAQVAAALPWLDASLAERLRAGPSNDAVLAEAIRASGRVVLGQTLLPSRPDGGIEREPPPAISVAQIGGDPRVWLEQQGWMLRNVPEIDHAAAGHGIFTVTPEQDGVVRRVPAMSVVDGALHPALSIEILRLATGNKSLGVRMVPDSGITGVVVRPNLIATDEKGNIWLYAARRHPEKYVSAASILDGTADPASIAGKLVLIGTSAVGLLDIRTTAVEPRIPGVEVHAQIIETVLGGMQLARPADAVPIELIATVAVGLLMIVLVPAVGARWTLFLLAAALAAMAGGSWHYFSEKRLLYDPVLPGLASLALYLLLTYASHSRSEAQRRMVRDSFSRYMSPALVERLAADPTRLKLGGEIRDMTVMFCDVRGFTSISERLDAAGLTRLINRFLTPMTDAILERRGTIDKYMGDCIMAFWNAPLDDGDHAANACRSALEMRRRLALLNDDLEAEAKAANAWYKPLAIGIGLNTGIMCVGNMGSDQRFDYSVLGDNVNLASRLEGQSKTYGVTVVLSEATRQAAPGFATLELDLIRVKGKNEPVCIHALLGGPDLAEAPEFQALARHHATMIAAYRAQDWDTARQALEAARRGDCGLALTDLYALYEDRMATFEAEAPEAGWDGVYTALTK